MPRVAAVIPPQTRTTRKEEGLKAQAGDATAAHTHGVIGRLGVKMFIIPLVEWEELRTEQNAAW